MFGSQLMSNGTELLLLVPEWTGVVGSIVLPVLGSLPDVNIILFSGLRTDGRKELDAGVGALAGSTIMLLTIAWFTAIQAGRVSIINNNLAYKSTPKLLRHGFFESLVCTGVHISSHVHTGSIIMMITTSTFLFLQIPGIYARHNR